MVRTYAEAGVSGKGEMIAALVGELRFRRRESPRMLGRIGHFTGFVGLGDRVLSMCTDGVGTKLLVAAELGKWDTVGIDCVAHNANDMVCANVEPVAFVDYVAIDRRDDRVAAEIGKGLDRGARLANVALIGGEIAVLPEVIRGVDLAGTCLGVALRRDVVTGEKVRVGDVIVGVASAGIHSNGFTLARRVFREAGLALHAALPGGRTSIGAVLLEPMRIYVRQALRACKAATVHGMAHITGGGVRNLARLKKGVEFAVTDPLPPQPVFTALQGLAGIADEEMYQTFNMGMGFAVVCPRRDAAAVIRAFRPFKAAVVGEVRRGRGVTVPALRLRYPGY